MRREIITVMRRVAAALGIGLVLEALPVMIALRFWENRGPDVPGRPLYRWSWIVPLTQEPGLHLVKWWVDVTRPGFEEQMGYIYFIPLIQWLVYAAVVYALLRYRKNRLWKSN